MELAEPGTALILTAEDGLADTVRPRLNTLGANASHIYALEGPASLNERGLAEIEAHVAAIRPTLVVLDPLVAYMGAGVDMYRANETRPILAALAAVAERHDLAVLLVRHLTKVEKQHAIYRGLGSIDITATSRSVLLAGCDPDDRRKRALVHIKSNLAAAGEGVGYRLDEGKFSWAGASDLTASRILGAESDASSALDEAICFLREMLAKGPQPAESVKQDAKKLDIADRTLRRAREELRIKPCAVREERKAGIQRWEWSLPEDGRAGV